MRKMIIGLVILGSMGVTTSLFAAPGFQIITLMRAAAGGKCTASTAKLALGGFIIHDELSRFICGVDSVQVPTNKISTASVYVIVPNTTYGKPYMKLCFRSMVNNSHYCGPLAYGTASSSMQKITAAAPSGTFDDSYVAFIELYINKTDTYNYFYGIELSQLIFVPFLK